MGFGGALLTQSHAHMSKITKEETRKIGGKVLNENLGTKFIH